MDFKAFLTAFGGIAVVVAGAFALLKWLGDKWFERRFEAHRGGLERLTEQLKHGLEREMLKAQLSTGKVHEVYPCTRSCRRRTGRWYSSWA